MQRGSNETRSGVDLAELLADLRTESADLDELVAGLDDAAWLRQTPAPGWTIAHQIAHLAWADGQALQAATDSTAFRAEVERVLHGSTDPVAEGARQGTREQPAELLARWRRDRRQLAEALAEVPAGTRLPWFGPSMGVASMVTARLMETWAHGQDIVDTLGVSREPTARLRHVASIGVRTRDFAFAVHELAAPSQQFHVELLAPDGESWHWGPKHAPQKVTGPALDFCLLVTQRRHRDDTAVQATGAEAEQWLSIAQAFAGPPGVGRSPGQFT